MIRVLVSDLGNVLLPFDFRRAWDALAAAGDDRGDIVERILEISAGMGFGRGAVTPKAFHERLLEELGLRMDFAAFCHAWSDIFSEDPEALLLIRQARVHRRYLLSNTDPIHWQWICEHYPQVLAPFDGLFPSHECGLIKPDSAIFHMVMEASGETPAAHLFVDDFPSYVEAARSLGMDAVVYRSAGQFRRDLAERGVL